QFRSNARKNDPNYNQSPAFPRRPTCWPGGPPRLPRATADWHHFGKRKSEFLQSLFPIQRERTLLAEFSLPVHPTGETRISRPVSGHRAVAMQILVVHESFEHFVPLCFHYVPVETQSVQPSDPVFTQGP